MTMIDLVIPSISICPDISAKTINRRCDFHRVCSFYGQLKCMQAQALALCLPPRLSVSIGMYTLYFYIFYNYLNGSKKQFLPCLMQNRRHLLIIYSAFFSFLLSSKCLFFFFNLCDSFFMKQFFMAYVRPQSASGLLWVHYRCRFSQFSKKKL